MRRRKGEEPSDLEFLSGREQQVHPEPRGGTGLAFGEISKDTTGLVMIIFHKAMEGGVRD